MSAGRAALVGLCEGSLIGMLFALLFGVFFNGPDFGGLLLYGIVTGGLLGTLFGALAHLTVSDGKRDFVSDTSIVAAATTSKRTTASPTKPSTCWPPCRADDE